MGIGGAVFGVLELTGIGTALVVLVAAAAASTRIRRHLPTLTHEADRARVFSGDSVDIRIALTGSGAGHILSVVVHDPIQMPDGSVETVAATLSTNDSRAAAHLTISQPVARRGVCTIGPLTAELSDPFGLSRRVLPGAPALRVTVLPRVDPLTPPPLHGDAESRSTTTTTALTGSDLAALREYVPGDDIRRVHWRTSARRDDLVVRQDRQPRRPGCLVVLDTRADVHRSESFEQAVSATASILVAAHQAGQRVRLCTTDGFDSNRGSGRDHLDLVLGELAVVQAGTDRITTFARGGDPIVAVTTAAGARRLADHISGIGLTVAFGDVPARTTDADPFGGATITVAPTERFATVWNARLAARGETIDAPVGTQGCRR